MRVAERRQDLATEQPQTGTGWPIVQIGDICDVQLGKMLSPKSKTGVRPIPYLRNENVQWNRFDLTDVPWMDFSEAEEAKFRLQPGDLLVCEGGEPGRAAVWEGQIDRCCYQKALHRIRPLDDRLHPTFLMYYLWATAVERELANSHGKTTIAHLPRERLIRLEIPLPLFEDQEQIVSDLTAALATVEIARRAAQDRLAAAEALPAANYREAFRSDACLNASPLTPVSPTHPGWQWFRLTELARLATGHTPSRHHPEYWDGAIPWIQLPDIRALDGRRAMDTSEHVNQLGLENSASVLLPEGTVCLSRTASVGFVTMMGRPMATSQDFVNWVCGRDLDPEFLMHLLIASRQYIRDLGSGAVHHTIYFPTVEAFSVCIPPIVQQRRIVANLSEKLAAAERLVVRAKEELAAIEALPAALLHRAFNQSD